jgi:UDP-N-acetyl-alpha-D-muramoyl-L-alanyl-L-glutamate epimerase
MRTAMSPGPRHRAALFSYRGLDVEGTTLSAHYRLDDIDFTEIVSFEGVDCLDDAALAVATLWYLIAGLSYYKAGAATRIDLGETPIGPAGRILLSAALHDGLGEFSVVNHLPLDKLTIDGGTSSKRYAAPLDPRAVLIPFGGGIDSVVSVEELDPALDRRLFVVSPASGRYDALEATAKVTGLPIVRATRTLDARLLAGDPNFFNGHVPVTAMVTLLAATAAVATGRGGVVMSNEHSASVPNLTWRRRPINHQWSKSLIAEVLVADAIDEVVEGLVVASALRDRSELWVAERFSHLNAYHHVFRSCNRAFTQDRSRRATGWCGECDKCLFINLVLAPFLSRGALEEIFASEPLANPARLAQLETLVGLGDTPKPFECVGDPDESGVALVSLARLPAWRDVQHLKRLATRVQPSANLGDLLAPQGPNRVPAHWLR